jgi:hypothetical protein
MRFSRGLFRSRLGPALLLDFSIIREYIKSIPKRGIKNVRNPDKLQRHY